MKNLITKDLVLTVKNKYNVNIPHSINLTLHALEDEFVKALSGILYNNKGNQLIVLGEKEIISPLQKVVNETRIPIISFDDVFSKEIVSPNLFYLSTSRQIDDYDNRVFSVTTSCGMPNINQQLQRIYDSLGAGNNKQVALYDLGIFSGGSLARVISSIIAAGFDPRIVYTSIIRQIGLQRIAEEFNEIELRLICLNEYCKGGWDELRDIIGIHGFKVNPQVVEFFPEQQTNNTFLPYTEIIDWFSLPYNPLDTRRLIELCEQYRQELVKIININLGLELKIVGKFQNRNVYSILNKSKENF